MCEQLEIFSGLKPTLSLSDSRARICRLLAKGEVWPAIEAVYSLRRCGLSESLSLNILSLKTSKVCLQITEELTLSDVCGKLPTLGYMSASGSLLIQAGYYPKIASGFTLSDILEENPAQKYFLSPVATKRLMEYKDNVQIPLRATDIQKSDKHRMLLKVNSLRKSGK